MNITNTQQKILKDLLRYGEKSLVRIKVGNVSSVIFRSLKQLIKNNYVIKTKNRTYKITEKGKQLITIIDEK